MAETDIAPLQRVGIMGGTFDPIHFGHLRSALEVKELLNLDEMRLLPCHIPSHRAQPRVDARQRQAMVEVALSGQQDVVVDDRELKRDTVSYSYDTLFELREVLGSTTQLFFVLGVDAFLQFHTWYRWQEILSLAHLVVLSRPAVSSNESMDQNILGDEQLIGLQPELKQLWAAVSVPDMVSIGDSPQGSIVNMTLTQYAISATDIRERVCRGRSIRYLVPNSVEDYIQTHHLYKN